MKSTHPDRLERWLGAESVANVSLAMRGWYGPPIAVDGVPGNVYACGDGDFVGECRAGYEATALDYAREAMRRLARGYRFASRRRGILQTGGFASYADLIAESRAGKGQTLPFNKAATSSGGSGGKFASLWKGGVVPAAGAGAAAAPGGTVPTSASTGALPFTNAISGDKTFVGPSTLTAQSGTSLLLYDRIFAVAKTMSSTTTEAVTGVPTRYTSTTPGAADYAAGNFVFPEITSTLGAGAHNWTVCQYTNQAGTTAQSFPSAVGVSTMTSNYVDLVAPSWFMPLASGDNGVLALTQMQCDASITGPLDFVIGHPLAWITCPFAGLQAASDGIKTAFNASRVFDNACLAFLEIHATGNGGLINLGTIDLISG